VTELKPSEEQLAAWRRQAESDLHNAKTIAAAGGHDVCVFLSQQAAEKMLKLLYMVRFQE
jgi:HEPN domain-containing protein